MLLSHGFTCRVFAKPSITELPGEEAHLTNAAVCEFIKNVDVFFQLLRAIPDVLGRMATTEEIKVRLLFQGSIVRKFG